MILSDDIKELIFPSQVFHRLKNIEKVSIAVLIVALKLNIDSGKYFRSAHLPTIVTSISTYFIIIDTDV